MIRPIPWAVWNSKDPLLLICPARVTMKAMLRKHGWDRSLARWSAFWEGKILDRPPVIVHIAPTWELVAQGSSPSIESILAHFDSMQNGPILDKAERNLAKLSEIEDDRPPSLGTGGGVYFTGAVFGAPVIIAANMMMCDPIIQNWGQAVDVRYDPGNIWVRRALGLARQLVARSAGRYAITPGLLLGPSDICASLRGITQLAADLYEYPDEVRRLARTAAEAWRAFAKALYDIIPLYEGGTVTPWSYWLPGRGAALQEDFCTVVSPRQFREFFAPLDRELARSVDTLWVHVHAGAIHLIDELVKIDEIRGIQIANDGPASPPIAKVLSAMQLVQRSGKCLIVRRYSPQDLEQILPYLSIHRLAIDTYVPTVSAAHRWLCLLKRWPFSPNS